YDLIDIPACNEAGVLVTIAPDGVRRPVATSALTYVLALSQKMRIKDRLTREGRWGERLQHIGAGLTGRVLGLLGIGNIGSGVLRLARPFEMSLLAHDPYVAAGTAEALGAEPVGFEDLFRRSDFLVVACPLNDETRGMVNAAALGLMK